MIGGSGFFGKSILDSYKRGLLKNFSIGQIYIFARNAEGLRLTNPELMDDSIVLINGDITSCESLPYAEYVIHAAASADASKYLIAPECEKKNILAGTLHFCNLAKQYLQQSKILYVSSGAVYGSSSCEMRPFSEDDHFARDDEIVEGKRHYAAAKRDSEAEIIALGGCGLSVSIARCFAFIGKYLPRHQHFAIGNFLQNGIDRRPIEINAINKVYRSYMYADDLVLWLLSILNRASMLCPIYNVGSSEVIEMRDLGIMISRLYTVDVKFNPPNDSSPDFYVPSIVRAQKELGLNCSYGLLEAIQMTGWQIEAA